MRFHELTVADVEPLTDEAVAVTFEVPDDLRDEYSFRPGQHLTIRQFAGGEDCRRSYSICSSPASGRLRIGVKRVDGGVFSSYALDGLKPGDRLEVMTPTGSFTTDLDPRRARHYAMLAAGSGITPVLSLASAVLETEPESRVTLAYGNRRTSSVMFLEELADLKNTYPARLHVMHVLSRETPEVELFHGRLDVDKLDRLLDTVLPLDSVDEWFLCGPFDMVIGARELLLDREVAAEHVHVELFHVEETPRVRPERPPGESARPEDISQITVVLDGRASTFGLERDTDRILDAAMKVRTDLPFACKGGVCGTCRCRLVSGEVAMARNYALEPDELAHGIRLACQSTPLSPEVTVDFDI